MWFDAPLLPLSPSEYFRRQGFVACDGDEGSLEGVTLLGWEDHVVWNTDYPHPDAPDPDKALDSLLAQPISEDAKRKILWDNPARLYGERILA
jgi:predicted TIM-barrel fold metal-dependent hydrolase